MAKATEVTVERDAAGDIQSATVTWLEAQGFGIIKMMTQRHIWGLTPAIRSDDLYRSLTFHVDGTLTAGNGLPLDGYKNAGNLPRVKPPLKLKTDFHDINTFEFAPASKYWTGRTIPDFLLTMIRHDGTPIHLSWSIHGPEHFQPIVTKLYEVYERMKPLVRTKPKPSEMDELFGKK